MPALSQHPVGEREAGGETGGEAEDGRRQRGRQKGG